HVVGRDGSGRRTARGRVLLRAARRARLMADRLAVFGHPVAHSLSPRIHHAFAEQTGRTIAFELIDAPPDGFADAVREFGARGGVGANVTVPHKLAALDLVGSASARAK